MDKEKLFKFCFGCTPDLFPKDVIITPFIPLKLFKKQCEVSSVFGGSLYSGFLAKENKKSFAVIHCGMGDRLLGDAVLLLEDTPVENILFAGACGGLYDLSVGDLIVCENAFDGEGFTRYHQKGFIFDDILRTGNQIRADVGLTSELERFIYGIISDRALLKTGNVFTIGSIVAETNKNLQTIERQGYIGIDLELSAVYHAASIIGRNIAGLVYVSDLPRTKALWDQMTEDDNKILKNALKNVVKLSVAFISR